MEEKHVKHFLEALTKMENSMEENKKIQQMWIKKLSQYIQNDPNWKLIDKVPFPIGLFKQNGMLIKANRMLMHAAGIAEYDLAMGYINLLNRITTENDGVLDAAEHVFQGETSVVNNLVAPISMFARDDYLSDYNDDYQTALLFPVHAMAEGIIYGAIVLMKQYFD